MIDEMVLLSLIAVWSSDCPKIIEYELAATLVIFADCCGKTFVIDAGDQELNASEEYHRLLGE